MDKRTGGCRCGAIRYEVLGAPVAQVACHCRDCQYVAGGGASLSMVFNRSGFTVLKGAPRVYKAKPASGGSFFCEACGVHVFCQGRTATRNSSPSKSAAWTIPPLSMCKPTFG